VETEAREVDRFVKVRNNAGQTRFEIKKFSTRLVRDYGISCYLYCK
jgi:hypothetical protein